MAHSTEPAMPRPSDGGTGRSSLLSGPKSSAFNSFENSELFQKKGRKVSCLKWPHEVVCPIWGIRKPRLDNDSPGNQLPWATPGTQVRIWIPKFIKWMSLHYVKKYGKELQEGAVREKQHMEISNVLRSMSSHLYIALSCLNSYKQWKEKAGKQIHADCICYFPSSNCKGWFQILK